LIWHVLEQYICLGFNVLNLLPQNLHIFSNTTLRFRLFFDWHSLEQYLALVCSGINFLPHITHIFSFVGHLLKFAAIFLQDMEQYFLGPIILNSFPQTGHTSNILTHPQ
jgi:hypothetical protein